MSLISVCCWYCAYACLLPFMLIFYMLLMWLHIRLETWENEFQLFLCLSLEIPASSAVESFRIECVEEASQLSSYFHQPGVSGAEIPFMGVIIPWVLAGFCLCILILSYVLLSYVVYLIMWKGKELGAWIISFNCSSSQFKKSCGVQSAESGMVQS